MSAENSLAEGFVREYLARDVEFIDIAEYVDENWDVSDEDFYVRVANRVSAIIDTIAQRYDEEDN